MVCDNHCAEEGSYPARDSTAPLYVGISVQRRWSVLPMLGRPGALHQGPGKVTLPRRKPTPLRGLATVCLKAAQVRTSFPDQQLKSFA
jgi:hypothetical protein